MSIHYIQAPKLFLAGSGTVIGATSVILTSLKDIYNNILTMADFGTIGYITFEPNTENEEAASFTGVTANTNGTYTLTGLKTCLAKSPYTETSGLVRQHSGGTTLVISDSAAFWNTFPNKTNAEVITGSWTTVNPTAAQGIATKDYIDSGVLSGAPDASIIVKGVVTLSAAPVSASAPIAVGDNDTRLPTSDQADALAGTSGTPSTSNKFVTEDDTNFTGTLKTTGDQSADGVKTFTSIPVLPASDPTSANQAARKAYVDSLFAITTSSFTDGGTTVYYTKIGKTYTGFYTNSIYGLYVDANTINRICTKLGKTYSSSTYTMSAGTASGNWYLYASYYTGAAWATYATNGNAGAQSITLIASITTSD